MHERGNHNWRAEVLHVIIRCDLIHYALVLTLTTVGPATDHSILVYTGYCPTFSSRLENAARYKRG
jgi:hypothetical protein